MIELVLFAVGLTTAEHRMTWECRSASGRSWSDQRCVHIEDVREQFDAAPLAWYNLVSDGNTKAAKLDKSCRELRESDEVADRRRAADECPRQAGPFLP